MKKYFETLGLKEGASQEQIKTAYNKLSKELNPANNDNQEFFKEEYEKVQAAYKSLYNSSILATEEGAKSKSIKTIEKPNDSATNKSSEDSIQKSNKNLFKYIWKRQRNISLLFLIIPVLKVILHYSIYPMKTGYKDQDKQSIREHVNFIFDEATLNLFLVSIGVVIYIAWFFNDKIKAR